MKFRLNQDHKACVISFTHKGRRHRFYPGTSDAGLAARIIKQMELDWNLGRFDETLKSYKVENLNNVRVQKTYRMVELWDIWIDSLDLDPNTKNNHYHRIRTLILKSNPKVEDTKWLLEKREEWSSYTFNSTRGFLKSCVSWAINKGYISGENPYQSISPSKKPKKDNIQVFTKEELKGILAWFDSNKPEYSLYIVFCLSTGCRPGEAMALTWGDVSFHKGTITIDKAIGKNFALSPYGGQKIAKGTKTGEIGQIPLEGLLRQRLTIYIGENQKSRLVTPEALVFANSKGGYFNEKTFRRWWGKCLTALNIPYRYPYQLRHTALSEVAKEQGVLAAAKLARHKNIGMVTKHYAKFTDKLSLPNLLE